MNKMAENNQFLQERLSQIKEFHMTKMRESFGGGALGKNGRQSNSLDAGRENRNSLSNHDQSQDGFDPMGSIN